LCSVLGALPVVLWSRFYDEARYGRRRINLGLCLIGRRQEQIITTRAIVLTVFLNEGACGAAYWLGSHEVMQSAMKWPRGALYRLLRMLHLNRASG
jgi:hypothetical protein